jgi:hypothetical protein
MLTPRNDHGAPSPDTPDRAAGPHARRSRPAVLAPGTEDWDVAGSGITACGCQIADAQPTKTGDAR